MRNYNFKVSYVVYVEEFGNFFKDPYFFGTEKVLVRADSVYDAEIQAIEIVRKKARVYNREQAKAVDENKIYFNVKLIF